MDSKRAKTGTSKDRTRDKIALEALNKDIDALRETTLPHIPHLLLVNTSNPFLPTFPHENKDTPFEPHEVKHLQYMTLVADADRVTALAKGDWEDEYARPQSADTRSNTSTPNPSNKDTKKASVKYSIKDYKNMKQTGVKPSPKPLPADAERKPGHSRNTSVLSVGTPMSRVPSMEGVLAGGKQNGASSARPEGGARENRSKEPRSTRLETQEKPRSSTNGNTEPARNPGHIKDHNTSLSKIDRDRASTHLKHGLPPRPQSPPRDKHTSDPKKRPLEAASTPAEKRTKIERTSTPSSVLNSSARPRSDSKPSPVKPQKSQVHSTQPSPVPRKTINTSKTTESKPDSRSNTEKPHHLPPLLSPLPADLENEPTSHPSSSGFAKVRKLDSGKNSSSNTPSKSKHLPQDTIVVKNPASHSHSPPLTTPPQSTSPPFVLPRLLSPGLPDIVEQELLRLQQKSIEQKSAEQKSAALNTVEARHEKARQPDTPGVARKTVKSKTPNPKVGHPPPRKTNAESSKSRDSEKPEEPRRLIVKLAYSKKKSGKIIEQLLRLKPKESREFKRLEGIRLGKPLPVPTPRSQESDSEEDAPLSTIPPSKPVAAPSKKRPMQSTEARALEPPAKRIEKEVGKGREKEEREKEREKDRDEREKEREERERESAKERAREKVKEKEREREKEKERVETPKAGNLKPAFKSPAPSSQNDKNLLATPKRGETMKTVAMRRVESTDSNARTPQGAAVSTPASAEKPRANGEVRVPNVELDKLQAEERRLTSHATKVKHKMDAILKLKKPELRDTVTETERKLGLSVGLEACTVYMNAFSIQMRQVQLSKRLVGVNPWESVLQLWVFMDANCRAFPVLQATSAGIGALIREEFGRAGVESKGYASRDGAALEVLKTNARERDRLWNRHHSSRSILVELGVKDVIGPWTTISDATRFAMDVFGAYSKKEKLNWKREALP